MAAVSSQLSTAGFYKAPVTKTLMVAVSCSHIATHIPSFAPFFRNVFTVATRVDSVRTLVTKLGKILVTKVAFPDPKNAILSLFLLYFFRVLERRTGSLKYSSNLALGWTIGVSLELLLCPFAGVPLPPGPLALLIPLFVPFFLHIPLISSASFGPVPISSKTMIYLLGLQLCLTSTSALLGTATSLLAGLAVFCSPLSSVMFPSWLGSLASILISPLASAPPDPGPGLLGATIEIQRTQQAEAMEQQLLRARTRFHVPPGAGGRQMRLDELWGGQGVRRRGGGEPAAQQQAGQPAASPVLVATLTDMGFPRERVEEALRQTNNDVDQATNLLLVGI